MEQALTFRSQHCDSVMKLLLYFLQLLYISPSVLPFGFQNACPCFPNRSINPQFATNHLLKYQFAFLHFPIPSNILMQDFHNTISYTSHDTCIRWVEWALTKYDLEPLQQTTI